MSLGPSSPNESSKSTGAFFCILAGICGLGRASPALIPGKATAPAIGDCLPTSMFNVPARFSGLTGVGTGFLGKPPPVPEVGLLKPVEALTGSGGLSVGSSLYWPNPLPTNAGDVAAGAVARCAGFFATGGAGFDLDCCDNCEI